MKTLVVVSLIIIASVNLGCSSINFRTGLEADSNNQYVETYDIWFLGLVGKGVSELSSACKNGISEIQNFKSTEDVFLTIVTFGIYAPSSSRITCARKT